MMRAPDRHGGDALRPGQHRQLRHCEVERREGEAVRRIDSQHAGCGARSGWHGVPVHLPSPGLRGIGGDAGQAMPLQPIRLCRHQGMRDDVGVRRAGRVVLQDSRDERLRIGSDSVAIGRLRRCGRAW